MRVALAQAWFDGVYRQLHCYTNWGIAGIDFRENFTRLFKPNAALQAQLDYWTAQIGGAYISVSFRFLKLIGDFVDVDTVLPLPPPERDALINRCLCHLSDIYEQEKGGIKRVLVCSDSATFLQAAAQLPFVFSVPGNIRHIDRDRSCDNDAAMKAFVDYFLISRAQKIFLVIDGQMRNSGFPHSAALLGGKTCKVWRGEISPPPPQEIPASLLDAFTMKGKVPVQYRYFDERKIDNEQLRITTETYANRFRELNAGQFHYYNKEGQVFFDALKKYPLRGKSVLIWRLAGCNCEALAVWAGAEKVFVVDYNKPICEHERIAVFNLDEFQAAKIRTDFAISYSSFEHDGLGRYGDPLSPDGDLRAMREAWESLNDGGILFFGVGLGMDCLVWNAHRIYGALRLPLMLRGWQLQDVFGVYSGASPNFPFDLPIGIQHQFLMVLRKTAASGSDEKIITTEFAEDNDGTTRAPIIYNRINRLVYCR
ncbi:hypothetical protein FACS1894139_18530 [Planctomycetales bacterium]|nr:hypothetical protein FACS1894108_05940 [Planctomycetales bacterium]GHT08632.1 hypothetical protein FACS1894139_18530 [Planctomycetales bacterium]